MKASQDDLTYFRLKRPLLSRLTVFQIIGLSVSIILRFFLIIDLLFLLLYICFNILVVISFAPNILESGKKLASKAKISPFFLGLLIIPFLSSFHEIIFSVISNLSNPALNESTLAQQMGNKLFEMVGVFGIMGLLLCRYGKCIQISPEKERVLIMRNGIIIIVTVISIALLLLIDRNFTIIDGLVLVSIYIAFIFSAYISKKRGLIEFDKSELVESEKTHPILETIKLITSVLIISFLGTIVVDCSSILIENAIFFKKFSFLIIGMMFALPNLIISIMALRKGASSLAIGLNIGSSIWELTISTSIIAFTAPISNLSSISTYILSFSLVLITVITIIYIRTHWRLKTWETAIILICYIAVLFGIIII